MELKREMNRLKFNYNILEITLVMKDKQNIEATEHFPNQ